MNAEGWDFIETWHLFMTDLYNLRVIKLSNLNNCLLRGTMKHEDGWGDIEFVWAERLHMLKTPTALSHKVRKEYDETQ